MCCRAISTYLWDIYKYFYITQFRKTYLNEFYVEGECGSQNTEQKFIIHWAQLDRLKFEPYVESKTEWIP